MDDVLSLTTALRKERENGGGVHMLLNGVLRSHSGNRAAGAVRGPHVGPHLGPHVAQPR